MSDPPPGATTGQPPLSPIAVARLRDTARPFTSDLSVNELATVEHAGFRALGLVMGSSVFHVGVQRATWTQSVELGALSGAMYTARTWAMARMRAECDALGADGAVGVRVELRKRQGIEDVIDFVAIGTAVKAREGAWRTPAGAPFTSALSGQEAWTLLQTGYAPVSFVFGAAVWHVPRMTMRQLFGNAGQNVELGPLTQAVYDAREVAMARMQAEAEREQAAGIVGVRVDQSSHAWGQHAVEFLATGTAVRPVPDRMREAATRPSLLIIPLSDRPVPVVGRVPTSAEPADYDVDFEVPGSEAGAGEAGGFEGVDAGDFGDAGGGDYGGGDYGDAGGDPGGDYGGDAGGDYGGGDYGGGDFGGGGFGD